MSIKYRPEIDGLRAIAVIAVVIYHAKFIFNSNEFLSGGFLGVDIFFVISGYLITSIILRELETTNSFNIARFYERRVRRILPALYTVMLTSIPFAWAFMLPKALKEYAGSALSSLFFGSNFWFWQEDSYSAEPSQLKPLLHTWTLSVEEQFYVIFPIILLLIWKFFKRALLPSILVLTFVSLALSHYGSAHFPDGNFYLLPTRGWELLAGVILAILNLRRTQEQKNQSLKPIEQVMPVLGIVMVVGSILVFTETMRHPSFITIIPIVGTMLLIWFCRPGEFVTRILSTRVFVSIGLVSYSLYLWHFPVFAFARIQFVELSDWQKIGLIVLCVTLSVISYFLIEKPARRSKNISSHTVLSAIFCGFVVLTTVYSLFFFSGYAPKKYKELDKIIAFNYDAGAVFRQHTCFLTPEEILKDNQFSKCIDPNFDPEKPSLFLWGDSHAAHLMSGYEAVYGETYNIVQRTASLCAPNINIDQPKRPGCRELNDKIFEMAKTMKPEKIVLASSWGLRNWVDTRDTIQGLQDVGLTNIDIVGPVPRWREKLPKLLTDYVEEHGEVPAYMSLGLQEIYIALDKEMRVFAEEESLNYLSPISVLCNGVGCKPKVGAEPDDITQFDIHHLTESGSIFLVERMVTK